MADKKTEKKKSTAKKADKKAETKGSDSKKKPEVKVATTKIKEEPAKERPQIEKKDHRILWTALITFFITALLFGMAFFVFMNLEVIDDNGRVRIEHGRIYIDGRDRGRIDDVEKVDGKNDDESAKKDEESKKDENENSSTKTEELISNPNERVVVKGAQLIEIGDFEFYLPKSFEPAKNNSSGKYVFNLSNDDGWADVKVYAEKTTADLLTFMHKKDSLLRLTNSSYYMNGTSWAEMESGSSTAYGTRLGDTLYVVILNVKLESDATGEAEQMIPKTIRLKRIYK